MVTDDENPLSIFDDLDCASVDLFHQKLRLHDYKLGATLGTYG